MIRERPADIGTGARVGCPGFDLLDGRSEAEPVTVFTVGVQRNGRRASADDDIVPCAVPPERATSIRQSAPRAESARALY